MKINWRYVFVESFSLSAALFGFAAALTGDVLLLLLAGACLAHAVMIHFKWWI